MKSKKNYIIGEFNQTGINKIDTDLVIKDWDHRWYLSQYEAKFELIKYLRRNASITTLKTEISAEQAGVLIDKLGLGAETGRMFRKGVSWVNKQSI